MVIEYDESEDGMTDAFIELADEIEEMFPHLIVSGNPDGSDAREHSFEVSLGSRNLFSRLENSRMPTVSEILLIIEDAENADGSSVK